MKGLVGQCRIPVGGDLGHLSIPGMGSIGKREKAIVNPHTFPQKDPTDFKVRPAAWKRSSEEISAALECTIFPPFCGVDPFQ